MFQYYQNPNRRPSQEKVNYIRDRMKQPSNPSSLGSIRAATIFQASEPMALNTPCKSRAPSQSLGNIRHQSDSNTIRKRNNQDYYDTSRRNNCCMRTEPDDLLNNYRHGIQSSLLSPNHGYSNLNSSRLRVEEPIIKPFLSPNKKQTSYQELMKEMFRRNQANPEPQPMQWTQPQSKTQPKLRMLILDQLNQSNSQAVYEYTSAKISKPQANEIQHLRKIIHPKATAERETQTLPIAEKPSVKFNYDSPPPHRIESPSNSSPTGFSQLLNSKLQFDIEEFHHQPYLKANQRIEQQSFGNSKGPTPTQTINNIQNSHIVLMHKRQNQTMNRPRPQIFNVEQNKTSMEMERIKLKMKHSQWIKKS